MNDFRGVLSLQVETLLTALRTQQDSRCRQLMSAAERRATELVRTSRTRLRERARQAVEEERRRRASALHEAQQRLSTLARREMQTRRSELVQQAWPKLITAMQSRWSTQASRSAWCETLLAEAAQILPAESWLIEHPPAWRDEDTRRLTKSLRDRRLPEAKFRGASDIRAGLRIRHGGACLDGTIDGLLSRRREVQARLIAAWLRRQRVAEDQPHG